MRSGCLVELPPGEMVEAAGRGRVPPRRGAAEREGKKFRKFASGGGALPHPGAFVGFYIQASSGAAGAVNPADEPWFRFFLPISNRIPKNT